MGRFREKRESKQFSSPLLPQVKAKEVKSVGKNKD